MTVRRPSELSRLSLWALRAVSGADCCRLVSRGGTVYYAGPLPVRMSANINGQRAPAQAKDKRTAPQAISDTVRRDTMYDRTTTEMRIRNEERKVDATRGRFPTSTLQALTKGIAISRQPLAMCTAEAKRRLRRRSRLPRNPRAQAALVH